MAAIFDATFREYGLLLVIRTDNGVPFASRAPGGLSRVLMRWVKLGIVPERSRLPSPQDNGRHERVHSTLQHATLSPPSAVNSKPSTLSAYNSQGDSEPTLKKVTPCPRIEVLSSSRSDTVIDNVDQTQSS